MALVRRGPAVHSTDAALASAVQTEVLARERGGCAAVQCAWSDLRGQVVLTVVLQRDGAQLLRCRTRIGWVHTWAEWGTEVLQLMPFSKGKD